MKEFIEEMRKDGFNLYYMDGRFMYFTRNGEGKKIELITLEEIVAEY